MPDKIPDHYCIQAKRIESMDKKIDGISRHFQVDGMIGSMSGQLERIAGLIEHGGGKKNGGIVPPKLTFWAILGLIAIIAALVGAKLPFG